MGYITQSLSTDESIQHLFKLHWGVQLVPGMVAILSISISSILSVYFGIFAWIIAVFGIYSLVRLWFIEQGLTNKRVIYKRGIVARKTEEMKLTSIETVEIDQSVFGRILGYGSVKVTGRGISNVVFTYIDDPMNVKRSIESMSNPLS